MITIDDELKACASAALQNAYYAELQALVAKYRAAAAGLGTGMETGQAQVEVCAWGDHAGGGLVAHDRPNVYVDWLLPKGNIIGRGARASHLHKSLLEALQDERAERVVLRHEVIFIKKDGEWFVAEKEENQG